MSSEKHLFWHMDIAISKVPMDNGTLESFKQCGPFATFLAETGKNKGFILLFKQQTYLSNNAKVALITI